MRLSYHCSYDLWQRWAQKTWKSTCWEEMWYCHQKNWVQKVQGYHELNLWWEYCIVAYQYQVLWEKKWLKNVGQIQVLCRQMTTHSVLVICGSILGCRPEMVDKIKPHKSELHPLPAWNIDESLITGNAEVIEAINKELWLDQVPGAAEHVQFLAGDQLSIAWLHALKVIWARHESGRNAMLWGAWIPGLFHAKIADALRTLLMHFSKPDTGSQDPNSLWYENTHLDWLPITITSLQPFCKCHDLLFVSLYACVLHCLLLVSECNNLEEYLIKFTKWEDLMTHTKVIFEQFKNSSCVQELQSEDGQGDNVFENMILFMCDALISCEFTDVVKADDLGRVILVLMIWTLSYQGNGWTKYAYEMLHLIHHLSKIWPKAICSIVLKNWLVNPTGNANSFVKIDLAQEHLNYWVKVGLYMIKSFKVLMLRV